MHLLYNIGIRLYGALMHIVSLFHPKAKLWVQGRKQFFSKLPIVSNQQVYWFHCASLGEFDQALPVINLLKEQDSSIYILVTFFSPSGYLHYHKRQHKADYVCYLPLDTPSNVRKFIHHFKPEKSFFVKYEFWANYIFEAKKSNSKIYSVSALFRADHRFFKKTGGFFRSVLKQFDHFFVQNSVSADLLTSIEITNYTITGDTRFDRVIENKNNLQKNQLLEDFLQTEKAFIIGSSWPADEEIICPLINQSTFQSKCILAPHDISKNHIDQITGRIRVPYICYSELEKGKILNNEKVLILDTIGHLANAYSYGSFAYVGGGFSGSLHNILEPAVFGLPVIFGPKHKRFPEAELFITEGIGFSIQTTNEMSDVIKDIEKNYTKLMTTTADFVKSQAGASNKIITFLNNEND